MKVVPVLHYWLLIQEPLKCLLFVMHDGRFLTLEQVLDHYSSGVVNSSTISSGVVGGIPMTAQEKQDIIAFLKTLSDYSFINDRRFADPFAP